MSLARLAALVSRAAAPPGRLAYDAPAPAFDGPSAIGTAMLQTGLTGAAPPPPLRRRAEAVAAQQPPRATAAPGLVADPVFLRPPTAPAAPLMVSAARVAEPAAQPVMPLPTVPFPAAPQRAPTRTAPTQAPHASPALGPRASMSPTVAAPVLVGASASHDAVPAAEETVPVTPLLPQHRPAAMPDRQHVAPPAVSPAPVAASPQPVATALPDPLPAISIGTVEVVMAQPPQRPAPATPARPAPDRGFSRYAAIRSGRDRVW
jgi:hypothetical protein